MVCAINFNQPHLISTFRNPNKNILGCCQESRICDYFKTLDSFIFLCIYLFMPTMVENKYIPSMLLYSTRTYYYSNGYFGDRTKIYRKQYQRSYR